MPIKSDMGISAISQISVPVTSILTAGKHVVLFAYIWSVTYNAILLEVKMKIRVFFYTD